MEQLDQQHRRAAVDAMDPIRRAFFRYLPISDADRDFGLYVTGVGYTSVPPGSPYPVTDHPVGHNFNWARGRVLDEFQLIYITRGQGEFESRQAGRRKIDRGSLFLLFPGEWHRYRPLADKGWDEYWLALKGDQIELLAARGWLSPARPLFQVGLDEHLITLFRRIVELVEAEAIGYQQVIAAVALEALAQALALQREVHAGGDRGEALVRAAKCRMAEHLAGELDMQALAHEFHISYVGFRRLFKHYTGHPPHQYHLQLRLNRAKELLSTTPLSIKQLSAGLGFESPYYFSRMFKKKFGTSPNEWRRR